MEKPLFIPLKAEYYDAFARGEKTSELRKWGKRWNGNVCSLGRKVVLSRGYGKKHRIRGVITQVDIGALAILQEHQIDSMLKIYNDPEMVVIVIHITTESKGDGK